MVGPLYGAGSGSEVAFVLRVRFGAGLTSVLDTLGSLGAVGSLRSFGSLGSFFAVDFDVVVVL